MPNLRLMQDYLLHRLKANNRHGVHSPFVYDLIDTVIYNFSYQNAYHEIADTAKNNNGSSGIKIKVLKLIYRLVSHFNPASIIKVGEESVSISLCLQKAAPDAEIIKTKRGDAMPPGQYTADLIVFNKEALTPQSFEALLNVVHPDTVMMLTGIYDNADIKQTWKTIMAHSRVVLTIDLFFIGLVFFKSGRKEKEHFKVKF